MFDVYCSECGMTRLLGPGRILGLKNNRPGVITVHLLCHEGHRVKLVTGRSCNATAPEPDSPLVAVGGMAG